MARLPLRLCTPAICACLLLISSGQPAHAGATEWMDLQVVDGFLVVKTEVAGIAGLSIIDTGAQVTAINARFLEAQDLSFKKSRKVTMKGVFSKEERDTYREVPATIFGAPVTFTRLVELELGPPEIQLFLGANFIDGYIFQFDYTNERMRLIEQGSIDLKDIKNVDAKMDRDNGSLLVMVNLDDQTKAWLQMDTGANGGLIIDRNLAEQLDWIDTYPSVEGVASGAISSGEMEYFRVPSIRVGPFELENVLVSIPAPGQSAEYFEKSTSTGSRFTNRNTSAGLLGYDVLQLFVVTIDYDRGHVHFYPGEKISTEPEEGQ